MNATGGNGSNSSIHFDPVPLLPLYCSVNSICIILSLPISYVLWLILSGAGGTIASEFFYLNLTVSMIIYSLASVFDLVAIFHNFILVDYVKSFVFFVVGFSAASFQCCICVERYIAVVRPVMFLRYKALRYRVACSCVVWPVALAFSSLRFWSFRVVVFISLGFNIVCISVVSFCCFSVLRALKQPGPGEGQKRDGGEGNNMKRRAFKIILISLVVMLVTTMSFISQAVTYQMMASEPVVTFIIYTIVMMPLIVHPLLYIHKAGKLPCFKEF